MDELGQTEVLHHHYALCPFLRLVTHPTFFNFWHLRARKSYEPGSRNICKSSNGGATKQTSHLYERSAEMEKDGKHES